MTRRLLGKKLPTSLRQYQQAIKCSQKELQAQVEGPRPPSDGAVGTSPLQTLSMSKPHLGTSSQVVTSHPSMIPDFFASNHFLPKPILVPQEKDRNTTSNYRKATKAIQLADNKNDVIEAFRLFAQSTSEKVTAQMVTRVCTSLVHLHIKNQLGQQTYETVVSDAENSNGSDRWKGLTPDESHCLMLYHARHISRYAEKGSSMDYSLHRTVEGSDNTTVGSILYQIQKGVGNSMVNAPLTALADLLYLDISWSVALEVFNKAKQLGGTSVPLPIEMTNRVTGLMTGYKTDGVGSRPWELALSLYGRAVASGYSTTLTTHTHALDALWRSGDSFFKKHHVISESHKAWVWKMVQKVRGNVKEAKLRVAGDSGCAYMEGIVKAASVAGRWDAVLSVLSSMDLTENTSGRLLLPTAETLLFAMAACNCARHKNHSDALLKIFEAHYAFCDVHSEVLFVYLQSVRHLLSLPGHGIGPLVEKIIDLKKKSLSRPCIVACLQLLSSQRVTTVTHKEKLAHRLFEWYDNCQWLQERVPRKVELETVFRCCHLIALSEKRIGDDDYTELMSVVRYRIRTIFGSDSEEERWLNATEVYALQCTESWQHALQIFERYIGAQKSPAESLPVPLYQVKYSLLVTLLRNCKRLSSTEDGDESFFFDDDERIRQSQEVSSVIDLALAKAHQLFPRGDFPHDIVGDFFLLKAAHISDPSDRKTALAKALQYFSIASQSALTERRIRLLSHISGLTAEHIRESIIDGHYALRRATLRLPVPSSKKPYDTKAI